eukprot:5743562-Alexandrium_andersonii.AAC.1
MGAYHNEEAKEVADELIAKAKWRASSNPKHKRDKRFRECSDCGCSSQQVLRFSVSASSTPKCVIVQF